MSMDGEETAAQQAATTDVTPEQPSVPAAEAPDHLSAEEMLGQLGVMAGQIASAPPAIREGQRRGCGADCRRVFVCSMRSGHDPHETIESDHFYPAIGRAVEAFRKELEEHRLGRA